MCKKLCAKVVCEGWCDENGKRWWKKWHMKDVCGRWFVMVWERWCDKIMRKKIY
jgi:hypothetical protein